MDSVGGVEGDHSQGDFRGAGLSGDWRPTIKSVPPQVLSVETLFFQIASQSAKLLYIGG